MPALSPQPVHPPAASHYGLRPRSVVLLTPVDPAPDTPVDPAWGRGQNLAAALAQALDQSATRCRLLIPGLHQGEAIRNALTDAARTSQTLVVYIAGQLHADDQGRLSLAGSGARSADCRKLSWASLIRTMAQATPAERLLLLDVQATAPAWERLAAAGPTAPRLLTAPGVALLGQVSASATAASPLLGGYWTATLTCLLRDGVPGAPASLRAGDLHRLLEHRGRPRSSSRLVLFQAGQGPGVAFRNAAAARGSYESPAVDHQYLRRRTTPSL